MLLRAAPVIGESRSRPSSTDRKPLHRSLALADQICTRRVVALMLASESSRSPLWLQKRVMDFQRASSFMILLPNAASIWSGGALGFVGTGTGFDWNQDGIAFDRAAALLLSRQSRMASALRGRSPASSPYRIPANLRARVLGWTPFVLSSSMSSAVSLGIT